MMDRRKVVLVSRGERDTLTNLRAAVAKKGLRIHVKMRFADVIEIGNSGLTSAEQKFALSCHIDFVITRRDRALFGVEFDGAQHDQDHDARRRDALKNSISSKLGLPLLRIGSDIPGQSLGATSVMEWLVDVFLFGEALDDFQDSGGANGEYLDPLDLAEFDEGRLRYPLDPSRDVRAQLSLLHKKGFTASPRVRQLAWTHEANVHATADMEVSPGRFVCSHARCRDFLFGRVSPVDLAEQLSLKHLLLIVDAWRTGDIEPMSWDGLCTFLIGRGAPVVQSGPSLKLDARLGKLRRASM